MKKVILGVLMAGSMLLASDKAIEFEIANYKKEFVLIKGEIQESAQTIKRFYDSKAVIIIVAEPL